MEKMNRLGNSVSVLAVMAIATTGIITPAIAGMDIATSPGTLKLAQASLPGQCRTARVQIPVFKSADITSEAVRLLAPDEQVTLADNSVRPSGFIRISAPVVGFVQSINLLPCRSSTGTLPSPSDSTGTLPKPSVGTASLPKPSSTPATSPSPSSTPATSPSPSSTPATSPSPSGSTATPTNKELCRRVIQPTQGLVIRQEPSIKAPLVGRVAYLGRVTLTTNPPTLKTADERDWIEISSPVKGWISHSLLTEAISNLAYCE